VYFTALTEHRANAAKVYFIFRYFYKYIFAALALCSVNAVKYTTIWPAPAHWNEDPNSRPTPLSGLYPDRTMTATQARWIRNGNADAQVEPPGKNMQFHVPYNWDAQEYLQLK
jgi:hypothetical protein